MPEIINLRQGAILNHNHGTETESSLAIQVEGISQSGYPVTVNGIPAIMDGKHFFANIEIKQHLNDIIAEENTPSGTYSQKIVVVWDKKSFKRYNFYIDDHSFLFTDLTNDRPQHAFDHFYLARLKKIHDLYGLKVTLNCFFKNDHHPFTLDQTPDIWKNEFQDNADWLKFSFHSKSEFPDRPYIESSAEEFGRDFDQVKNEIFRFAGEKSYIAPVVVHWGNIHPTVAQEYIRRGSQCYPSFMRPCIMGGPSLAERMKGGDMKKAEERSMSGKDKACNNESLALYYTEPETKSYLKNHLVYYEPALGITIFGRCAVCCNLTPLDKTEAKIRLAAAENRASGCEILCLATHEQYSYPYYPNYQPDHLDRVELAVKTITEEGYKPIFFNEGYMGNETNL